MGVAKWQLNTSVVSYSRIAAELIAEYHCNESVSKCQWRNQTVIASAGPTQCALCLSCCICDFGDFGLDWFERANPAPAVDSAHWSTSTIIYHHLPSSTIIYHHLPSSTIIYHHLPLIPVGQNKDGAGAVRPCFNQFDRRPWVELVKSPHPRGHCCKKPWGKTGRRCLLNQVQVIGLKLRKVWSKLTSNEDASHCPGTRIFTTRRNQAFVTTKDSLHAETPWCPDTSWLRLKTSKVTPSPWEIPTAKGIQKIYLGIPRDPRDTWEIPRKFPSWPLDPWTDSNWNTLGYRSCKLFIICCAPTSSGRWHPGTCTAHDQDHQDRLKAWGSSTPFETSIYIYIWRWASLHEVNTLNTYQWIRFPGFTVGFQYFSCHLTQQSPPSQWHGLSDWRTSSDSLQNRSAPLAWPRRGHSLSEVADPRWGTIGEAHQISSNGGPSSLLGLKGFRIFLINEPKSLEEIFVLREWPRVVQGNCRFSFQQEVLRNLTIETIDDSLMTHFSLFFQILPLSGCQVFQHAHLCPMGCPESNCHRSCVSWGRFHRTYGGRWEQSVGEEKDWQSWSCKTEKKKRIQIHQKSQENSFQIQHFVMFNVDLHMQV